LHQIVPAFAGWPRAFAHATHSLYPRSHGGQIVARPLGQDVADLAALPAALVFLGS
jgi:hypothetical protein